MKLLAVCVGQAEYRMGNTGMKTGINKHPVSSAVMVDREGLVGDAIINRKYHGGPDQAIYIEGSIDLDWWSGELGRSLEPGTFGENLVIEGLDNRILAVGDRFTIGEVILEVTSPRTPCATFTTKMADTKFAKRYIKAARPGAYCRVLMGGTIEAGVAVDFVAYQGNRIPLRALMTRNKLSEDERARYLCAPIHFKLRQELASRKR